MFFVVFGGGGDLEDKRSSHEFKKSQLHNEVVQLARRNSLRVTGIQEKEGGSTGEILMNLVTAIGADISLEQTDRSHRLRRRKPNKPGSAQNDTRPRDNHCQVCILPCPSESV